jgi:hypothetical protein
MPACASCGLPNVAAAPGAGAAAAAPLGAGVGPAAATPPTGPAVGAPSLGVPGSGENFVSWMLPIWKPVCCICCTACPVWMKKPSFSAMTAGPCMHPIRRDPKDISSIHRTKGAGRCPVPGQHSSLPGS